MKIVFVANHYVSKKRAMQGFMAYLTRTASALKQFGNEVVIVACGMYSRHFWEDGIEVYIEEFHKKTFHNKAYEIMKNYLLMSRTVNKRINILCRREKIDMIQFTSLSGLSLCYFGKVPAVMRLSSYAKIAYETHQTLNAGEERMVSFLERMASKRCIAVFAPCKNTAVAFSKDIKRNVSVIESPFYNDTLQYDDSIYAKDLQGKKYVLFFGQLYAEKGILVIADILDRFLKQHKDFYLVFCGATTPINGVDARKLLKRHAKEFADRVIFYDPLPHSSLYYLIIKADFIILPSLMENLSNACIESMYFGKVVLGTDGASFEQLIVGGKNGLLCKPNNSLSLLTKMNEAAAMSSIQKQNMGELAQKRIERLYPQIAVRKLLDYYKRIIDFAG